MTVRKLDEFELGDTLGVGTVGTIYEAVEKRTGKEMAVKILLPTVSKDPLIKARFEREMLILERLRHRNIVEYFGGGRDGDQLFYAMELVHGGTLKELLQAEGRLSWQETATCAVQICSALQQAHNMGVIHRDLKPANLFFTRTGELKLGDFGIARDTTSADITSDGLTVGTYAYMSPEQIVGERMITGQSDLYALGCLLYEMLTGSPPFEGNNFAVLFEQHLRNPPPRVKTIVPDCPDELETLIVQLMDKNPANRPFNARAAQVAILRMLDRSLPPSETQVDKPAEAAIDHGRALLSRRLKRTITAREAKNVSWLSLACLALVIIVAVGAAYLIGAAS